MEYTTDKEVWFRSAQDTYEGSGFRQNEILGN